MKSVWLQNVYKLRKPEKPSSSSSIMFSTKDMPSPSTMFSAYASMAASMMLFRSIANELVRLVPFPIRHYVADKLHRLFKFQAPMLTLVIEESNGMTHNRLYDAAETYLCSKISLKTGIRRLKLSKSLKEKHLTILLDKGETLVDSYDGIEFHWKFACTEQEKKNSSDPYNPPRTEKRFYELSFHSKHQDIVLASYVPFLLEKAEILRDQQRVLKMYTLNKSIYSAGVNWESINLEHPATFDTLAMDPDLKSSVIEDLNRFLRRKEFYKKVGRAWKRGYLLYGPPGTGKSSLVAAMANYLKFDIYDLQLANIFSDSELRKLLLATANRSILVIEDIDCSVDFPDRLGVGDGLKKSDSRRTSLTLAGLLNFIDGLWSSCGDERIIIFTTNHKDRIDPSLLRPGRMDMHIHMSYCTYHGFKLLASNYLGIDGHHKLFPAVESLMVETQVTPAQVAEEMMKSEDVDVALEGLIKLLKYKKMEKDESDEVKAENNGGIRAALKQRTVDQ